MYIDCSLQNLRRLTLLVFLTFFITLENAGAASQCSDSFEEKVRKVWGVAVQKTQTIKQKVNRIQSKLSIDQWLYRMTTPKVSFDAEKFEEAKKSFESLLPSQIHLENIKSVEELLAFLEIHSRHEGRDLISMIAWKEYNWPTFARYIERISKFDLSRGIYVEHVENWIFESYWAVHGQAYINWDDIKSKKSADKLKEFIVLRSHYEIARSGVVRALKETGVVRNDNIIQKLARDIKTSQAYRIILNTAVRAPFYVLTNTPLLAKLPLSQIIPFLNVPAPLLNNIRHNIISEELVDKVLLEGEEKVYPLLEKELNYAAKWDNGINFVKKVFFVSGIIAQAFLYPHLIAQAQQINERALQSDSRYLEIPYPESLSEWESLSVTAPLPRGAEITIKTPIPKNWGVVRLKINHMYIDNPYFLIKPQYGSVSDMRDRFNAYSENYFHRCMGACTEADYESFMTDYLYDLPKILPEGRENLADLIRSSILFNVAPLGSDKGQNKYEIISTTTLKITQEMNEFDRRFEARQIGFQIGKPVQLPARTSN